MSEEQEPDAWERAHQGFLNEAEYRAYWEIQDDAVKEILGEALWNELFGEE